MLFVPEIRPPMPPQRGGMGGYALFDGGIYGCVLVGACGVRRAGPYDTRLRKIIGTGGGTSGRHGRDFMAQAQEAGLAVKRPGFRP